MNYYAYINDQSICEEVYALPAPVTSDKFIAIEKVLYDTRNVIGLKWTGSSWIKVEKYYYAVLLQKNFRTEVSKEDEVRYFVKELVESTEKINDPLYIQVDELSSAKVGQLYNPDTAGFVEPEFVQEAFTDTNYISVNGTNEALTDKLNKIEKSIKNMDIPEVTAASVLEKLKTVDGVSSGLDADLLDGKDSTYFATSEGLQALSTTISGKAPTSHSHNNYASTVAMTGSGNAITAISQSGNTITATKGANYALDNHGHGNYASTVAMTGSGNAITAISQSGNTITAVKGANYALSNHEHGRKSCAVIKGEASINVQSTARFNLEKIFVDELTQEGGWSKSGNDIVVPKTGKYLVMLSGEIFINSANVGQNDGLGAETYIVKNATGEKLKIGQTYTTKNDIVIPSSRSISTKGDFTVLSFNKGDVISIQLELEANGSPLTCSARLRPTVALFEI